MQETIIRHTKHIIIILQSDFQESTDEYTQSKLQTRINKLSTILWWEFWK